MSYDLLNGLRIGQRESFISTLYDHLSTSSPLECLAAGKFQQESHVTRTKQGEPSKTVESVGKHLSLGRIVSRINLYRERDYSAQRRRTEAEEG